MKLIVQILSALLYIQASWAFPEPKPDNDIRAPELKPYLTDGEDAFPGEFPYQASIEWRLSVLFKFKSICGGSILNENWILTSAQCVLLIPVIGTTKIKVGKHNTKTDSEWVQVSDIQLRLVHSDYNLITKENDIALLKVKKPFILNKRVQPVHLSNDEVEPETKAIITGWGSTSKKIWLTTPAVLQKAEVEVIDIELCNDALRALSQLIGVQEDQICTGPLTKSISTCVGDMGSPLVKLSEENDRLEQIGIASWNVLPCGKDGAPSVYTRISPYVAWIKERILSVDYN